MKSPALLFRRRRWILLPGSLIYALLFTAGSQMESSGTVTLAKTLADLLLCTPVAFVILQILAWGFEHLACSRGGRRRRILPGFHPLPAFLLLLVCWLPMLMIYFPGSFTYDCQYQAFQVALDEYSTRQPLIHTLMIRELIHLALRLSSFEKACLIYNLFQMTLLSLCFTGVAGSIERRFHGGGWLSILFFGLHPLHMVMASNCVKDTLFSGFFALFVTLSSEYFSLLHSHRASEFRRSSWLLLVISSVLCILFRNNTPYAMGLWLLLLLVVYRKSLLRFLFVITLSLLAGLLVNSFLLHAVHSEKGPVGEMLSVPIQQLSRARLEHPEAFSVEEATLMDRICGDGTYHFYEPTLADPVKEIINDRGELDQHPGEFLHLWLGIGLKCPRSYVDAFVKLMLPALYPYQVFDSVAAYVEVGHENGVLTEPFGQPRMVPPSRFEGLRQFLKAQLWKTGANSVPVLRWVFNIGLLFWLLFLLFLFVFIHQGNLPALLFPLILYATFLLGPVMQARYAYSFICLLPLFLASALGAARSAS